MLELSRIPLVVRDTALKARALLGLSKAEESAPAEQSATPRRTLFDLAREAETLMAVEVQSGCFGDVERQVAALGRAILREEGISRLDEAVSLVDYLSGEIYNWSLQMVKVRYTESHLVKPLGGERAEEVIDLMQDDIEDGIEVHVIPGQVIPDDRVYRAERAREDAKDGLIDPLTYLEAAGSYDNPKETVKRLLMYKANPYSLVEMTDEDMKQLAKAAEVRSITEGAAAGGAAGGQAAGVAMERMTFERIMKSPDFQNAPPEKQLEIVQAAKERLKLPQAAAPVGA